MTNTIYYFTTSNPPSEEMREEIATFLFEHLVPYGDCIEDIKKSLDYAFSMDTTTAGGFVVFIRDESQEKAPIIAASIVNHTGMERYVPSNLLVYIATHPEYRGQGLGGAIIEKIKTMTDGGIALHCEPDNPAKKLYEKMGFTSKYLEMRVK